MQTHQEETARVNAARAPRPTCEDSCIRQAVVCFLRPGAAVLLFLFALSSAVADDAAVNEQLRQLREQNERMQDQLRRQQQVIDSLERKVSGMEKNGGAVKEELPSEAMRPLSFGKILLSGEGGLGLFGTGSEGQFPNSEFRVDEAKLFLDAQVWKDVYFFAEVNFLLRESPDEYLNVGEVYLDFENVSKLFGRDRWLNIRIGRFDIPFGEEYLTRDAIDNPLISHSLSDIWGVDEGVEFYGAMGKFRYVLAIQNGGHPAVRDFDADKAVIGRLSFAPTKSLRASVSAMRTGDIDVVGDEIAEVWFGNDWLSAMGASATKFHASIFEGDVQWLCPRGHLSVAGGYLNFDDNDPTADNRRDVYYYYVEGVHDLMERLYFASRFSQILAGGGFIVPGQGGLNQHYTQQVSNMWRLSVGLGYRWGRNLLLKVEYSFEQGREMTGALRNNEDAFGLEMGFRF